MQLACKMENLENPIHSFAFGADKFNWHAKDYSYIFDSTCIPDELNLKQSDEVISIKKLKIKCGIEENTPNKNSLKTEDFVKVVQSQEKNGLFQSVQVDEDSLRSKEMPQLVSKNFNDEFPVSDPESKNQTNFIFKCEICKKIFTGTVPYLNHLESSLHKTKQLKGKSRVSNSKENGDVLSHKNTVSSFAYCEICSKEFNGPIPYQQHVSSKNHFKKGNLFQRRSCYAEELDN